MGEDRQAVRGDGFLINGHFACVVNVNPASGLGLIRVFADPTTYAMHLPQLNALVSAFDKLQHGDQRC